MTSQGEEEIMKLRREFVLSQSDILNLHNGITLFDSEGENIILYLYNIFCSCKFNTTSYQTQGIIKVFFTDLENNPYFEVPNSAITFGEKKVISASKKAGEVIAENKNLIIKSTEPILDGDGEIHLFVEYNKISI